MSPRMKLRFLTPHDRLRLLQSIPLFSSLDADDLVLLAEYAEEEHRRRGAVLVAQNEPVDAMRVLVEGSVVMRKNGKPVRRFDERSPIGVLSALRSDGGDVEVVTTSRTLCLKLDREVLLNLLEDRFVLFSRVLRATARQLRAEREAISYADVARDDSALEDDALHPEDVVDRFLVLREGIAFVERDLFGLWHLSRRAASMTFVEGEKIFSRGEPSTDFYYVAAGAVRATNDGATWMFGPQDSVGVVDLLAEEPRSYDAVATKRTSVVQIEREELLDIFEDHFELGMSCLSTVTGQTLRALEKRAERTVQVPSGFERLW